MLDARAKSPLLVFADDWGRHPSSCQHLIKRLLEGRDVDWVNTIGMRPPRFDLATLRRGLHKVADWARGGTAAASSAAKGLRVHNPRMWPWYRTSRDRRFNRFLLAPQLRRIVSRVGAPPIAITTVPITADLVGAFPVVRWVYYCVDDFSQWPGLEHAALDDMERKMVEGADVIIAVSEVLRERIGRWGRRSSLLTHGVDLRHWSGAVSNPVPAILEQFERPLIIFWGLIDQRIDVDVVRTTAAKLERGTIVLIGPDQNAAPCLWASSRVARIPAQSYDDLPALARAASVLIMPYADAPVTRAMQPLKLKEYLATGKPTVVTELPSVRDWKDCLDIAKNPDEFADSVKLRLHSGLSEHQRLARQRLSDECWTAKARFFERLIDGDTEASDLALPEPAYDETLALIDSKKALGCRTHLTPCDSP